MHVAVRSRIFLARHGWIRWAVVLALATGVGWATFESLSSVDRQRSQWGASTEVIVAASDLQPDGPIDVETMSVPTALLPDGVLSAVPADARLRQYVGSGEILTARDVSASPGPAGLADPGTSVVGIVDSLARMVVIGIDVQVASEGITLADRATVVGIVDEVVFVAVPTAEAAMVAAASHAGLASLIFLP
nr:putative hypothetical protein [uncultured bacterium]